MKIIHQHPPIDDREEILRDLHTACLRALRRAGKPFTSRRGVPVGDNTPAT